MKKFDLKVYSFNEVEPVSLEDIKGGFLGLCCWKNTACNKNTKDETITEDSSDDQSNP